MKIYPCMWLLHGVLLIHILLLGCYTRFSFTLIKWCWQLAKITILLIQPLYPIPLLPIELTNWPINEVHIRRINLLQIFPCQYIQEYPISIVLSEVCMCICITPQVFIQSTALDGRVHASCARQPCKHFRIYMYSAVELLYSLFPVFWVVDEFMLSRIGLGFKK